MMTTWLAGLAIGTFFGFFWGYESGRKQREIVVIEPLPEPPEKESERA